MGLFRHATERDAYQGCELFAEGSLCCVLLHRRVLRQRVVRQLFSHLLFRQA